MKLENFIVSEVSQAQIKGKHNKGIGLWSQDKVRAHKGGIRLDKTPQKQDSIRCPQWKETNAETLKWQRSIGEGDQELEKSLAREDSI
jgi:hypothetical protein